MKRPHSLAISAAENAKAVRRNGENFFRNG